jgi:DNA-binding transcriptional regulator YiaG
VPVSGPDNQVLRDKCGCQEVLLTRIKRRDWDAIVSAIMKAGIAREDIARQLGINRATVYHWQHGGEPKESDARKVLALYRRHVGAI